MRDKIIAILKRFDKMSMQENVELMSYGEASEKIMGIIHSEMVGLIPAEKRVSKLGNLAENDRNEGYNLLRSELLSAIEKKFKEGV